MREKGLELVEQGSLRRKDSPPRFIEAEPACAVHLGKFLLAAGFRRPLHPKRVAAHRIGIAVAGKRPGEHRLAALGKVDHRKRDYNEKRPHTSIGNLTPVAGVQDLMKQKAENSKGGTKAYYETLSSSPLLFPPDDPATANLFGYKNFSEDELQQYFDLFNQVTQS